MTTQHFVSPEGIDGDEVRFDPDEARHLFKVLRCRPSDEVEVIDGEGGWYRVRLDVVERRGASGTVLERRRDVGEPRAACTIAVGTLKSADRFETFVEKAVELGVTQILPITTARTQITRLRLDRLRKIMIAALKQSRRSRLPLLTTVRTFEHVVAGMPDNALCIMAHEAGPGRASFADLVRSRPAGQPIVILIGPEGGFTDSEVQAAVDNGWQLASLGPRRLRAETAAIAAVAGVMLHAGRSRPEVLPPFQG